MATRGNKRARLKEDRILSEYGAKQPKTSRSNATTSTANHRMSFHYLSGDAIERVRNNLLAWYDTHKRDLPWRKDMESEPKPGQRAYEVWVSEIMLQQTVNKLWAGLGYYSRAKRLWEGAQNVVKVYDGILPSDAAELEKNIPGIGKYTAGAISSIAYGQQAPLVDGNVIRVLARQRAIGGDVKASATIDLFWDLAKALVPADRPGDFNQALMELGATVCTPRNPLCDACPVRTDCFALQEVQNFKRGRKQSLFESDNQTESDDKLTNPCKVCVTDVDGDEGTVTKYPFKSVKKAPRAEECAVCILERSWRDENEEKHIEYLLLKRPEKGLLAGLWEFPQVELVSKPLGEKGDDNSTSFDDSYEKRSAAMNQFLDSNKLLPTCMDNIKATRQDINHLVHLFSHIRKVYHIEWYQLHDWKGDEHYHPTIPSDKYTWMDANDMPKAAIPTALRKALKLLAEHSPKPKKTNRSISSFFLPKTESF